ncbi:hypothetical protein [Aliterella atlantica]|uniref:hypothetical protein n=1 Tax=Aliterella atlantica TaxID=1827278 RepID=UPI0019100866|nr:hypothetical protein [Aliterella atlantica]
MQVAFASEQGSYGNLVVILKVVMQNRYAQLQKEALVLVKRICILNCVMHLG